MKIKFKIPTIFLIVLILACSKKPSFVEDQVKLHQEYINYFEEALQTLEKSVSKELVQVEKNYNSYDNNCSDQYLKSSGTSIYIPKSAIKGSRLNCLMKASQFLEKDWEEFYNQTGFISWQYIYDGETKVLRLHPDTNSNILFGDDLIFDAFFFFKGAIKNYPQGAWSPFRDDINGTGKIIIYSKATKLMGNKNFTVLGKDIRVNQILKKYYDKLLNFSYENKLKHVFIYGYLKNDNQRVFAHDFSTDPSKLNILKPTFGKTFEIEDDDNHFLEKIENEVGVEALAIKNKTISLLDTQYYCTVSKSKIIDYYSLICSQF